MKKILLSLGALATIVAPVISVVSCGATKKKHTETEKPHIQGKTNNLNTEEIIKEVSSFDSLSKDQINGFVSRINKATEEGQLDEIKKDFLGAVKEEIYKEFASSSDTDLSTFRNEIESSNNLEEITQTKSRADKMLEAKLLGIRHVAISDAYSYIESLAELNSTQKNNWCTQVDKVEEITGIKVILLNATKENGKAIINNLKWLVDDQKDIWKAQIEKINLSSDIDPLLIGAVQEDGAVAINSFDVLTKEQKAAWVEHAHGIKTIEDEEGVINELKTKIFEKNARYHLEILENYYGPLSRKLINRVIKTKDFSLDDEFEIISLDKSKNDAIEEVSSYHSKNTNIVSSLTLGQVRDYIARINACHNKEDIKKIMDEMRASVPSPTLYACNKVISIFTNPQNDDKATEFIQKIINPSDIDSTIEAATLEKMKLDAIANLNLFKSSDPKKTEFEDKFNAAKTEEAINLIIQEQSFYLAKTNATEYLKTCSDLSSDQKLAWTATLNLDLDAEQINTTLNKIKSIVQSSKSAMKTM